MDERARQREAWLASVLGDNAIAPLAGDASFRRYFRVNCKGIDYVLMDAPPQHEDVKPFLAVLAWFNATGIRVSRLFAESVTQGFLLLEDFGDETWASYRASGNDLNALFEDALYQLHLLQGSDPGMVLPRFDMARMRRECDLYLDWYLPKVAGVEPTAAEREQFHASLAATLETLTEIPVVPVHLDYHSRNLMLPEGKLPLGMIDYQDAVMGPVTYDLASLLYDCYQDYPEQERLLWSEKFFGNLPPHLAAAFGGFDDWHHKLRLTALQRHIKAIGIFGRLAYRDGKLQFLDEIPLTRKHLQDEMAALGMARERFPLLYIAPSNH
ncbi:hypothetical protein Ga0123462_0304 [Mariprofundus ferrinatatus]|uniref:Aminoglycoside phosphotransferase domain-containing protein n=1 Tax=Mariprofundus ferrinatatus TaxID=1921087 RepID=A0A2K8L4L6_9PROT|nr:phosphotransferase [Mariprofundus ferrinatatus]ATX81179.1 hypothetical protein Ga0123462_0304 [Mariprofundus ferrinatatus]